MLDLSRLDLKHYFIDNEIDFIVEGKNVGQDCFGVCCPWCGDTNYHIGVFLDYKNWSCWRCKENGSLYKLMQELTGMDWGEFKASVETPSCVSYSAEDAVRQVLNSSSKQKTTRQNYKATLPRASFVTDAIVRASSALQNFLKRRDFTVADCQRYDARFAFAGKYALRLVLPIYHYGKVVGFQARDVTGRADSKYDTPANMNLKNYLYGHDQVDSKQVMLVEGPLDVWRLGNCAAGMFGKRLSDEQLRLLRQLKADEYYICLDGEAYWEARALAGEIRPFLPYVKAIKLPNGEDPDSLGKARVMRLIYEQRNGTA